MLAFVANNTDSMLTGCVTQRNVNNRHIENLNEFFLLEKNNREDFSRIKNTMIEFTVCKTTLYK